MTHLIENSILITGASGFIGKNLVSQCLSSRSRIFCIKRDGGIVSEAEQLNKKIRWIYTSEINSIGTINAVVHLATSYGNLDSLDKVIFNDVVWPLQVFDAASKVGCKKFINVDSFFSKDQYSYRHMEEYILAKKSLRACLKIFSQKKCVDVFNAVLEHVYGPHDSADKFINGILKKIYLEDSHIDLTLGDQKRDFIYVDDVVDALMVLVNSRVENGYNEVGVGTGVKTSLRDFLEQFKKLSKSQTNLNFGALSHRQGEIMESVADLEPLITMGWVPKISLESGLSKIYESFL